MFVCRRVGRFVRVSLLATAALLFCGLVANASDQDLEKRVGSLEKKIEEVCQKLDTLIAHSSTNKSRPGHAAWPDTLRQKKPHHQHDKPEPKCPHEKPKCPPPEPGPGACCSSPGCGSQEFPKCCQAGGRLKLGITGYRGYCKDGQFYICVTGNFPKGQCELQVVDYGVYGHRSYPDAHYSIHWNPPSTPLGKTGELVECTNEFPVKCQWMKRDGKRVGYVVVVDSRRATTITADDTVEARPHLGT